MVCLRDLWFVNESCRGQFRLMSAANEWEDSISATIQSEANEASVLALMQSALWLQLQARQNSSVARLAKA
jgi:hypothetical protein